MRKSQRYAQTTECVRVIVASVFISLAVLASCFVSPSQSYAGVSHTDWSAAKSAVHLDLDDNDNKAPDAAGSVLTQPLTDTSDVLSDSRLEIQKNIERIKAERGVNIWVVVEPSVAVFTEGFTLEDWCSATAKASEFGKDDVLLVIQTARHDTAIWVNTDSQFITKKQAQNELDMISTYLVQDNWSGAVLQFSKDIESYVVKSNDLSPYIIVALVIFCLAVILSYSRLNKSTMTVVGSAISNIRLKRSLKSVEKDSEMIGAAVNVSDEILDDLQSRIDDIAENAVIQTSQTTVPTGSVGQVSNGLLQMSEKGIRGLTDKITKNHVLNKYLHLGGETPSSPATPTYTDTPLHDTAENMPPVTAPILPSNSTSTPSVDNIYSDYYTNSYSRETYGSYYHSDDNKTHDEEINAKLAELDKQIEEFTSGASKNISSTFRKNHSDVRKYYVKEEKKAARKENKEKKQFHSRFKF